MANTWYNKYYKITRKAIREAFDESLKAIKINSYKAYLKKIEKFLKQKAGEAFAPF